MYANKYAVVNMADGYRSDSVKNVKNPLLTAAAARFPFENSTNAAYLVPVTQSEGYLCPEGKNKLIKLTTVIV